MDIRKIKKLIELMEETNLVEIEIKEGEESLRLSRQNNITIETPIHQRTVPQTITHQPLSAAQPNNLIEDSNPSAQKSGYKIRSPMVGTMYASPSPESPPFVTVGQIIKVGDVICIVEAMKMFNEIEADHAGKVVEILVKNGDPVEYDQPLFILEE